MTDTELDDPERVIITIQGDIDIPSKQPLAQPQVCCSIG